MSRLFSWLHLSDLHIRGTTKWEADSVTRGLEKDLKQLAIDHNFRPDAIFFTGDAVFGNENGEDVATQFKSFGDFLDRITQAFVPPLPKSAVFIVPGNHDIDRRNVLESDTFWLRDLSRSEDEIIRELQKNSPMCQQWMGRLMQYRTFLRDYGLDHLDPDAPALIWSEVIKINDKRIGIAGLNSAWSCATRGEKAKLWMGGQWQIGELCESIGDVDLSFALVHHPSNWLNEIEDPLVGRKLENSFDIVLHGHEHQEFFVQNSSGGLRISAGACYDRQSRTKGYSIGSVAEDDAGGKLWLRTWDEVGSGWVAKNVAKTAPNGVFIFNPLSKHESRETQKPRVETSSFNPSKQLISLTGPPSDSAIDRKASLLRRRPFVFQESHSRVRADARLGFEEQLISGRIAWLVADWQMGKDGFIASALNDLGSGSALENVYRLDCGETEVIDDIFENAGAQLGVTFVEFAALVEHLKQATLVLEDFPFSLLRKTDNRGSLIQKLTSTINFTPTLRIIVTMRQWAGEIEDIQPTVLTPLGINDLGRYLQAHRGAKELRKHRERLEDIRAHTSGLPAAIDRLISKSNVLPIAGILDDHVSLDTADANEQLPKTLNAAVSRVFSPSTESERRKLNLLKLLTVLKDGESFEALKRAFPRKPFRADHVIQLAEDALIESVPIAEISTSFLPSPLAKTTQFRASDSLLRVPRQVRDHVESLIPSDERSRIYNSVSETLFGVRWYEGKVKLRRAIVLAYRESTVAGPGNELLVAQYLLKSAIERGNRERILRYARLAVDYCGALLKQDRFRDAVIACRAILKVLDEVEHAEPWTNCAYCYARAARMTGLQQESADLLHKLLEDERANGNEFLALINLNLAWNYEKLSNETDCLKYARSVISFTHKESDSWFQASALIAKCELTGASLEEASHSLYVRARNLSCHTAANNIALDLAKRSPSRDDSVKLLDEVIKNAKDLYNQTRAIVDKADLLRNSGRIEQLTNDEQLRLCRAYEYSCAQRLSALLDSCHDALWEFCTLRGFWAGLFRLFRFSSFVWCLSDRESKESQYIPTLIEAKSDTEKVNIIEVDSEVEYLERRISSRESNKTQKPS